MATFGGKICERCAHLNAGIQARHEANSGDAEVQARHKVEEDKEAVVGVIGGRLEWIPSVGALQTAVLHQGGDFGVRKLLTVLHFRRLFAGALSALRPRVAA